MQRTISSDQLIREETELSAFMLMLTKRMVKRAAMYQPALLPRGARLRGIKIIPDVWLGRDLVFYKQFPGQPTTTPLSTREVLAWVRAETIRKRIVVALASVGVPPCDTVR